MYLPRHDVDICCHTLALCNTGFARPKPLFMYAMRRIWCEFRWVSEGHICQGCPPETPQITRAMLPCSHFSHHCKLFSLRQIRAARWLLLRLVLPTLADNNFVICRNFLGGASLRVLQCNWACRFCQMRARRAHCPGQFGRVV